MQTADWNMRRSGFQVSGVGFLALQNDFRSKILFSITPEKMVHKQQKSKRY